MLRWILVLLFLAVLTGLMSLGVLPTLAIGVTHFLFQVYAALLGGTVVVALLFG